MSSPQSVQPSDPNSPAGGRPNVDTAALGAFLESIKSYNQDLIFQLAPGQKLYHYTDLNGLLGIVRAHDLWLTHSRYSNDEEEITHGYSVLRDVIAKAREAVNPDPTWPTYLDHVAKYVEEPPPEGFYICCFCLKDNLLSQWRSYGANGTGVCVRFDPEGFSWVTGPDSPHGGLMRLWKVFYEPQQQRGILRSAIDFAFLYESQLLSVEARARRAADAIEFFIPTFKNEDFSEENEWRLIFTPSPGVPGQRQFRAARGMLVPYYSLKELSGGEFPAPGGTLPITAVRVGPSAHKRLNVDAARILLAQANYTNVEVDASDTPYRG